MNVSEALLSRRSVRAFLDRPVPGELIRDVIRTAARAPSGGNVQPWHIHVVAGAPLEELKAIMRQRVLEAPGGEPTEYDIYPKSLWSPYRERRFELGEDMYRHLGIPREDKAARLRWMTNNYQFFGAPVGLFCSIERDMGPPQWSDLGMFLLSVMLLLRERGLDSCPQECWSLYPQTLYKFLDMPPERMLFAGMAIGYADSNAPVNQLRSKRAAVDEFAHFIGL